MASSDAIPGPVSFRSQFRALTDNPPYPWQESLFESLIAGNIPRDINLPTGTGKTSIMPVWLLALAWQSSRVKAPACIPVPRRLVWVVDRRVVVDQATSEAEQLASRLTKDCAELKAVRDALRMLSLSADAELLAISTLRGEKEDNRAWSADPSRPAIIVGTVDMIGSRLLFSGYGDGKWWRPQHAGLLGQDTLFVNDEAHLTPAFVALLGNIRAAQQSLSPTPKSFWVMGLTATHIEQGERWPESLDRDREHEAFRKVFEAPKRLQIHPAGKQDAKLLALALETGPARTLIFVRKPEKAQEIATKLNDKLTEEERGRILTLTGTMRGFERDRMVHHPVFEAFAKAERPSQSCWIIATSAGEVGVNISADRLITDLDTAEHLLQRFGRLNRFGETVGVAYLLVPEAGESDRRRTGEKEIRNNDTLDFLRTLPLIDEQTYDISTAALFSRELPPNACTRIPLQATLHNWIIEVWSQTTLGAHPARPQVEPWLHGKQEDYPETYVAWREDVRDLARPDIDSEDREAVLEKHRVLAHERLREPTQRLREKLQDLLRNSCEQKGDPGQRVLCRKPDGSVEVFSLRDIVEKKSVLEYCQLLFPPGCGVLEHGMFSPIWGTTACQDAYDVSGCCPGEVLGEAVYSDARACYRATPTENGWSLNRLGGVREDTREYREVPNLDPGTLRSFAEANNWRFLLKVEPEPMDNEEEPGRFALLYFRNARGSRPTVSAISLTEHLSAVAEKAWKLGTALGLPEDILQALRLAGEYHDWGKQELVWQRAAGNDDLSKPVAKPKKTMRPRALNGFRHELASLRYAEQKLQAENVSAQIRDLTLHLIAAHHGHARPCFTKKAYSHEHFRDSERFALESAQRFGRLQERYGPWGLAYLESIFRSADALASAEAEGQADNE
jgi:CRISPR-associated endonuclease/helicase Cas3